MQFRMNRITRRITSLLALVLIWVTLSHCSSDPQPEPPQFTILEKAVLMGIYSAEDLQEIIPATGLDIDPQALEYNVDLYLITYKTSYKGNEISASGLAAIPSINGPVSMLSVHHGTITQFAEAPSASTTFSQQAFFCAAFSSLGFITVMSDLIGFGESRDILHPYYDQELYATAVIDNLKAVVELANVKGKSFNKDLFLAGYSEGGYVTMATHKYLDLNPQTDFNLVASFPAAGGYDIKDMQEYVFGLDTFEDPYYLAYLTYAYQYTYGWSQPLSDFFNEPYATKIPDLFDGTLTGSEINEQLTTSVEDLLTPGLLSGIDSDPKFSNFVNAMNNNSLTSWSPVTPMYMYHGDADTTVPYQNSVKVYEQLLQNGADPAKLELITLPGADHATGLQPYIEDVVAKLLEIDL
jgi:pimeloyl-ACP methyl ester carboxylesterase